MAVNVNLTITDNQVAPAPIAGVVVNVYDPAAGYAFVASSTSDGSGLAAFLLPGNLTPGRLYELRFYKMGVILPNPVSVQVIEPQNTPTTNNFAVQATGIPSAMPVASDPRLCRCTGSFLNFQNRPVSKMLVRVWSNPEAGFESPKVIDGNMIAAESFETYTDVNGKVSFDLPRGGQYSLMYAGEEETIWNIQVPDRGSINLIDLIHPAPVSLTWDPSIAPANAVVLAVGQTVNVPFSVLFTDFETNVALDKWLDITFPDISPFAAKFLISPSGVFLSLTGVSPGTAAVTVGLQGGNIPHRIPDYSLSAPQLNVTVS